MNMCQKGTNCCANIHSGEWCSTVNVSQVAKVDEVLNPIGFRQWVVQNNINTIIHTTELIILNIGNGSIYDCSPSIKLKCCPIPHNDHKAKNTARIIRITFTTIITSPPFIIKIFWLCIAYKIWDNRI